MIIFFTLAALAFLYILITSAFGHDHDASHDVSHEISHDVGHDADGGEHETGHITSIFSTRVIAMFLMGFNGAAGVARYYNYNYPWSCVWGVIVGLLFGVCMFYLLEFFAKQQSNSLVQTRSLIGCMGTVETAITSSAPGEVAVSVNDRRGIYLARSRGGEAIGKGNTVMVVSTVGSDLIVELA